MIWATVSSRSCFSWLYRISPFLTTNNIINLISVLTIWWYPCINSTLMLFEKCAFAMTSLDKPLLAFVMFQFVLQGQTCLLFQVSFDLLLFYSPKKKRIFFFSCASSRRSWVALHRTVQLCFLQDWWLGHRHELLWWCEWFILEMNQAQFVIFKIAPKYCISDSLVDCEGYSISSLSHSSRYNGHLNDH